MSNNTQAASAGFPILGVLGIVFVVLKLTGVIDWSWWWVTAPFWAPIALFTLIFGGVTIVAVLKAVLTRR